MATATTSANITTALGASVRIVDPEASYGIFMYDTEGNLSLISDWGNYATTFRAFGSSFSEFLSQVNTDYLLTKLAPRSGGKHSRQGACLRILISLFIGHMKSNA